MFGQIGLRLGGGAVIFASLLLPQQVLATEEAIASLAETLRAVENLSVLGEELKEVLTPEVGFPEDYMEHWHAAVDEAFTRETLEADFLAALRSELSEEARDAALAFDATPLGREMFGLAEISQSLEDDPDILEKARAYVDAASPEENALFVDLFEAQMGPERANDVMDIYFRAMRTAAEPIVGEEAVDQWIAQSDELREVYVEDYFLITVMTFGQLAPERLEEMVETLATPEMIAYAEQSTKAFATALHAAADRLETAYKKELDEDV